MDVNTRPKLTGDFASLCTVHVTYHTAQARLYILYIYIYVYAAPEVLEERGVVSSVNSGVATIEANEASASGKNGRDYI